MKLLFYHNSFFFLFLLLSIICAPQSCILSYVSCRGSATSFLPDLSGMHEGGGEGKGGVLQNNKTETLKPRKMTLFFFLNNPGRRV